MLALEIRGRANPVESPFSRAVKSVVRARSVALQTSGIIFQFNVQRVRKFQLEPFLFDDDDNVNSSLMKETI